MCSAVQTVFLDALFGQLIDLLVGTDAKLEAIAAERLAHYDPKTLVSWDEMMQELDLTEDDLAGWEDVEVE